MNRNKSKTYLPLNPTTPVIGSLRIGKWIWICLIKYKTKLIRLLDVCLVCKSDYKANFNSGKVKLSNLIHIPR